MDVVKNLLSQYKNFVFLGETGSGKTVLALNLALKMATLGKKAAFFDLDQTKPMFRARDVERKLTDAGIEFHYQNQHLDAPTVTGGVIEALTDPALYTLLDIGGGSHGSHMIGQFSHIINGTDTVVLYIVNPYRAWSSSVEEINTTILRITRASGIRKISMVANPNFGSETTAADVISGVEKLSEIVGDTEIQFLMVSSAIEAVVADSTDLPILHVDLLIDCAIQ